jgi:hypothetical protein
MMPADPNILGNWLTVLQIFAILGGGWFAINKISKRL